IAAASATGKPPTPVPNATRASEWHAISSAFHSVAAVQRRTTSADVVPPGCSIVTAWITHLAGMSPAGVAIASPSGTGACLRDSSSTTGPPARAMAAATPPPCSMCALAALVIASTPSVVMSVSRASIVGMPPSGDFDFVFALEALAAALHGGDELREVDLERVEDFVGVVLGAEADLALAGPGVLDDVLGGALGLLGHFLLRDPLVLALAGLLDDALGLALGLGEHLLALLDDPARLLDLLRDRRAHLVEDVVDLLFVHAHGVRQGDPLGVVDQIVQLVDQYEDVHCAPGIRWRADGSCKRPAPSRETQTLY